MPFLLLGFFFANQTTSQKPFVGKNFKGCPNWGKGPAWKKRAEEAAWEGRCMGSGQEMQK
jgi:hypothetical protein